MCFVPTNLVRPRCTAKQIRFLSIKYDIVMFFSKKIINFTILFQLIRRLNIESDDTFIDLGSGIGTIAMQVAAMTGSFLPMLNRKLFFENVFFFKKHRMSSESG